ncbi:inositol polyphosphate 1-phosphatase-like isoform X2 [Biomphalaria glabrata]|uniref:inositol-1,4-bisphosphate 1-phosphatase n=1 Tax=Biomphalaria glabrata TaxID=6526 RepID=A0A9W2Z5N4_BIOGL|nr:inositol polyphosphate 1-phosphatase-like isoform X2 [Biomphalaria glabrata]
MNLGNRPFVSEKFLVKMYISDILRMLLKVSAKASQIATIIRKEKPLVELLVEEKRGLEKNNRFFQDFKTLADVLIQETVRHYISEKIPNIGSSIYGEESNKFTNSLGDCVVVTICHTCEETQLLLQKVLNGNTEAACLLAEAVHSTTEDVPSLDDYDLHVDIDTNDCGIWIDPIDSTGQYIKGETGEKDEYGMVVDGLQCVAILIGMFQKSTGKSILGVAVQPFAEFNPQTNSWISQTLWGVCYKDIKQTSLKSADEVLHREVKRAVLSNSESEHVQDVLRTKFQLVFASGAGYKILATILGLANAYVLSHRSIYRWDCCAGHAILLALGGGIISYKHALEMARKSSTPITKEDLDQLQVNYVSTGGAITSRRCSISDGTESLPGIVAYLTVSDVLLILDLLKNI